MVTVGGGAAGQTEAVFRCEHVGIIQLIQHRHRALNTPAHSEESQNDGAVQSEPVEDLSSGERSDSTSLDRCSYLKTALLGSRSET